MLMHVNDRNGIVGGKALVLSCTEGREGAKMQHKFFARELTNTTPSSTKHKPLQHYKFASQHRKLCFAKLHEAQVSIPHSILS
jgi:hypothetical protein